MRGWGRETETETRFSSSRTVCALSHASPPSPVSPVSFSGTPEPQARSVKERLLVILVCLSVHPPHSSPALPVLLPVLISTPLLFLTSPPPPPPSLALGLSLCFSLSSLSVPSLHLFPLWASPIFSSEKISGVSSGVPNLTLSPSSLSVLSLCSSVSALIAPQPPSLPVTCFFSSSLSFSGGPGSRLLRPSSPGRWAASERAQADDSRAPASLGAVTRKSHTSA